MQSHVTVQTATERCGDSAAESRGLKPNLDMLNPTNIVTVGDLPDKYMNWAEGHLPSVHGGRAHPELVRAKGPGRR